MELIIFGLNHRTAPVDVRERWAFSAEESRRALIGLRERVDRSEHVILCTCNRTEFYSHVPLTLSPLMRKDAGTGGEAHGHPGARAPELLERGALEFYRQLKRLAGRNYSGDMDPSHFYVHRQEAAIEHLFRLAGGLDSMILGESEILKQIKDAFQLAQEAQTAGKVFNQLFPAAIRVGKRVRATTGINKGCITPGQAALKLAREVLGSLGDRSILLMGSGKIATMTARAFLDEGVHDFTVVNRTSSKAQELVEKIGAGTAAPWSELRAALVRADLVISSTGAVEPVVSPELMQGIQEERRYRPLMIVDLAVPRDFDPAMRAIGGVNLFHLDNLNSVIQKNVSERHSVIPLVEEIVREELLVFQGRMFYMQVDPVLRHLVERFEQIRQGALQEYISRVPADYHPVLQELSSSLVKKLLHFPIEKLKSLRDLRGLNETEVAFLRRLFLTEP